MNPLLHDIIAALMVSSLMFAPVIAAAAYLIKEAVVSYWRNLHNG